MIMLIIMTNAVITMKRDDNVLLMLGLAVMYAAEALRNREQVTWWQGSASRTKIAFMKHTSIPHSWRSAPVTTRSAPLWLSGFLF